MSYTYKDIAEIRRENIKSIIQELKLSRQEFAQLVEISYPLLGHYIGKNPIKKIGDDIARKIELMTNKPVNWLDNNHSHSNDVDSSKLIPVITWIEASNFTSGSSVLNPIQFFPVTTSVPSNAFALVIQGRNMMPEFKPNDLIIVTPIDSYKNISDGDLVIVSGYDKNEAIIQQFIVGENYSDIYLVSTNDEFNLSTCKKAADYRLIGKVHAKYQQYSNDENY